MERLETYIQHCVEKNKPFYRVSTYKDYHTVEKDLPTIQSVAGYVSKHCLDSTYLLMVNNKDREVFYELLVGLRKENI